MNPARSFTSFYKKSNLFRYDNQNVVYIAHVGVHQGNDLFKYGMSTDVFQREYLAHRANFKQFNMTYIGETNYKDKVETVFEKELKIRNVHKVLEINNKKQTELFITNDYYDYMFFETLMKDIIEYYDSVNTTHQQIYLEELKLKQLQAQLKLKQLEYKMKSLKK